MPRRQATRRRPTYSAGCLWIDGWRYVKFKRQETTTNKTRKSVVISFLELKFLGMSRVQSSTRVLHFLCMQKRRFLYYSYEVGKAVKGGQEAVKVLKTF